MRQDLLHIKEKLENGAKAVAKRQFGPKAVGKENIAVSHLGNEHISLPTFLLIDPILEPVDKIVFSVIRFLSPSSVLTEEQAYPTYNEICKYSNIGSHATVARALSILELTRWLVRRQVRTFSGTNANVYVTHNQPLSVKDLESTGTNYEQCLATAIDNKHKRVHNVALTFLTQYEQNILSGKDTDSHPLEETIQAKEFFKGKEGTSFFGLEMGLVNALKETRYQKNTPSNIEEGIPVPSSNIEEHFNLDPSSNIEEGIPDPSSNIEEGIPIGSSNIEEPCSSSSLLNITTTTQSSENVIYAKLEPDKDLKTRIAKAFDMLDKQKHFLLGRYLMRLEPTDRDLMILEVSNRIRYGDKVIKNPVGYLGKLCGMLTDNTGMPFTEYALDNYKPITENKESTAEVRKNLKKELTKLQTEMSSEWAELKYKKSFLESVPGELQEKAVERSNKIIQNLSRKKDEIEAKINHLDEIGVRNYEN